MSRHNPSGGYGHRVSKIDHDHYRLSWAYDRYYTGSPLRFPQTMTRDTDHAGAIRFAKKWSIEEPRP